VVLTFTTLEGEVSSLETELADSEAKVSSLQSDLKKAEDDIETQQTINSALSEELKTVKDPRHFASLTELADWLQRDDTDTEYSVEDWTNMCLVLQVKALRDGYLLPAYAYYGGGRAPSML